MKNDYILCELVQVPYFSSRRQTTIMLDVWQEIKSSTKVECISAAKLLKKDNPDKLYRVFMSVSEII